MYVQLQLVLASSGGESHGHSRGRCMRKPRAPLHFPRALIPRANFGSHHRRATSDSTTSNLQLFSHIDHRAAMTSTCTAGTDAGVGCVRECVVLPAVDTAHVERGWSAAGSAETRMSGYLKLAPTTGLDLFNATVLEGEMQRFLDLVPSLAKVGVRVVDRLSVCLSICPDMFICRSRYLRYVHL